MDALENRESSLKELPTREMKLKRHKIRRDSPTIPPIRLRLKNNVAFVHCEADLEKYSSDKSVPSSPDSASQEHSPVFITASQNTCERNSSPVTNESGNESCEAFNFISKLIEDKDYDQPLDMSRKRTDFKISENSQSSHHQQVRPSVITCASALLRTHCNLSDVAHTMCTIKANCDSNSNDIDYNYNSSKPNKYDDKAARFGHRREIVSGSCDPVIDEHFRRSLGKDYQNIFSKSSGNNVSITVDDHFAKALGETWHQLQQSKTIADSVRHSSDSIQPQQGSQFLQPPEILS